MRVEMALTDGGYVAVTDRAEGVALEVGFHGEGMAAVELDPGEASDVSATILDLANRPAPQEDSP